MIFKPHHTGKCTVNGKEVQASPQTTRGGQAYHLLPNGQLAPGARDMNSTLASYGVPGVGGNDVNSMLASYWVLGVRDIVIKNDGSRITVTVNGKVYQPYYDGIVSVSC